MNGEFLEKYHEEQITKDNRVNDVQDKANDPRKSRNGNVLLRSLRKGSCTFPLGALAYTRSGDKGNNANIGVVCKNPGFYPYLAEALTEEVVQSYFSHLFEKDNTGCSVKRYELPGISAFNFVLENSLRWWWNCISQK
eukprot:gene8619-9549_t